MCSRQRWTHWKTSQNQDSPRRGVMGWGPRRPMRQERPGVPSGLSAALLVVLALVGFAHRTQK